MTTCDFALQDGSYVLGALSPAERQHFEQHLSGCPECAQSVRELAGLPGLLARIDADVLASPPVGEPVPETLLPALVRDVRRTQRRRVMLAAGVAAAAAVVLAIGSLAVTGAFEDDPSPATRPPAGETRGPASTAMLPIGHVPVRASVAFTSVQWGTRLDLTCSYSGGGEYGTPPPQTYAMFVRTDRGHLEQVATWRGLPGRTMHLAAATASSRQDIRAIEVRTTSGKTVLELVL